MVHLFRLQCYFPQAGGSVQIIGQVRKLPASFTVQDTVSALDEGDISNDTQQVEGRGAELRTPRPLKYNYKPSLLLQCTDSLY